MISTLQAARISRLAYRPAAEIELAAEPILQAPVKSVRIWDPKSEPNRAVVITTRHRMVVAFRGTEFLDRQSAAQNFRLSATGRDRLHSGYVAGVEGLNRRGLTKFVSREQGSRLLSIVGHSAGGALADIFAHTSWLDVRVDQVETQAAPRTTKSSYYAELIQRRFGDKRLYVRLAAVNDPVPWAPPKLRGWKHSFPVTYLDRKSRKNRSAPWPYMLWDGFVNRASSGKLLGASLTAHRIDTYIERLEKCATCS